MPRYTICLLLCLACSLSLHAQILAGSSLEPEFQQLKIDDEGTEAQVTSIFRDESGYMWFGTEDGLYRYNGYEFVSFRHDPSDSLSIAGNSVQTLFEDKDGMIWCGTTRGLSCFDPLTQQFKTIDFDSAQSGLVGSEIYAIVQDDNGILWIATWGGLNLLDPTTLAVEHILLQTESQPGLPDFRVMNVCISSEVIWIATLGGLCATYTDESGERRFVHYFDEPGNEQSLYGNSVYWVHEDQNGILWYGTHNGFGKIHFPDEGSLADRLGNVSFELVLPETYGRGDEVIWKMQEDDDNHFWLSSWGRGLIRYSLFDGGIDRFSHDPEDVYTISNNGISSLLVDPDSLGGSVWVGTLQGINVYHPEKRKFRHIKHDPDASGSLSDSHIHSIFEDSDNNLWVGTINGLNLLKPQSNSFERLVTSPGNPNGLRSNHIISIYEDQSGRIWVGTFEGLTWYDPVTRRFLTEPALDRIDNLILRTYDFQEDGNGMLWLATRHGLVRYNHAIKSVKKFDQDPTDEQSLPNSEVRSLFIDSHGRFWVGTANGLALFDRHSETVRRLSLFKEVHHSQTDPAIWCIHEDNSGTLWFASSNGLFRGVSNEGEAENGWTFDHFSTGQGLPSDHVSAILEDRQHRLWLATTRGLSCFDIGNQSFTNYTVKDGLQNNDFIDAAYCRLSSGHLLFGAVNGLNVFHPDSIQIRTFQPPVVITDFRIYDKPVSLDTNINFLSQIPLKYNQNFLSFEFAALDYLDPPSIRYAYRMRGLDPDWIESGNRRYVSYTNLGSGTYDFQVRATNSDGVWGGAGRSLQLVISPPPWKTWWAYSIYGILIALVIWGWRRFELQKEREKAFLAQVQLKAEAAEAKAKALNTEKELEKYQLRNRISADLHDEIGSNLSSISLLSAMAAKREDIQSEVKEMLSDMNRAARHSSEAIRDIVWFINPASDQFSDLISRMRSNAKNLLPDVEVQFEVEGDDQVERLHPELKRNVYLIGKELLTNISKHAGATQVHIRLDVSDHSLAMEIADNGVGFDLERIDRGQGLNNMEARARQINGEFGISSIAGKGTTSTLHVNIT